MELYLETLDDGTGPSQLMATVHDDDDHDEGEDGDDAADGMETWSPPQPSELASSLRSALADLPDPYPQSTSDVSKLRHELFEGPTLSRGQLAVLMTKAATPALQGGYPGEVSVNNACPVPGCPKVWTGQSMLGNRPGTFIGATGTNSSIVSTLGASLSTSASPRAP